MSDAEHLIENVIYSMSKGLKFGDIVGMSPVKDQLESTGISADVIYDIAQYVVYGLYDGKFPAFFLDELDETSTTPEEFKNAMEEVFKSHDIELRHAEADQIMCDTLRELGYEDGVKIFEESYKWHA